jgi:hypothetical protein
MSTPASIIWNTAISPPTTNVGDIPHTATELKQAKWDTGVLEKGQSKAITFSEPGNYFFICTPHPWMYGASSYGGERCGGVGAPAGVTFVRAAK